MAQDKFLLLDLNDWVLQFMEQTYTDVDGGFDKMDWTQVKSTVVEEADYQVQDDIVSGSFSARTEKMTNKTSKEQMYELSESFLTRNRCCVDVHCGVRPGAAPVHLQMPKKLEGRGLPPMLKLTGSDDGAVEEVTWKTSCSVRVPSNRTVIASFSGSVLRLKGTFSQKTRLTGDVIVRRFEKGGVFSYMLPIPLDELMRSTIKEGPGMTIVPGGIEYTLMGKCDFHITVDSSVQLEEVKNP